MIKNKFTDVWMTALKPSLRRNLNLNHAALLKWVGRDRCSHGQGGHTTHNLNFPHRDLLKANLVLISLYLIC